MEIDGKKIASEILSGLKQKPKPKKFLAAFLVGEDSASVSFLKKKETTAKELGIDFRLYRFPNEITSDALRREVGKMAEHKTCGGAIVQLSLPKHINAQYILNAIPREKDIDVLGERALGAFYADRNPVLPPAVGAVEKILQVTSCELQVSKVAVVGRGLLVGRPIALWLISRVAELAIFTSKTEELEKKLTTFNVVISGVGKAGLIRPEYLKEDAVVIDFGYDEVDGKIQGDFGFGQKPVTNTQHPTINCEISYTPTPGGTGPILVAKLFENFFTLNPNQPH